MANLFPCPSCGGQLVFDSTSGQMKCTSCDNLFNPMEYTSKEIMQEDGTLNLSVFICPNCGGEITADNIDGMEFCPYCGDEIINAEHFSKEGHPDYIIPFSVSKEDCKNIYETTTKKVKFLPDDLKGSEGLKRFVGLYTPYWLYDFDAHGEVRAKADKYYTSGSYDYHEEGEVNITVNVEKAQIPYDASQTLDDTVAKQVEPYYFDGLQDFNPNYMAGFYAENSTVDENLYVDNAKGDLANKVIASVTEQELQGFKMTKDARLKNDVAQVERYKGVFGAYLPIWFLTVKKNDRVAYTMINGQTGKMYADFPVDLGKYFKSSLVASAICIVAFLIMFGSIPIKNTLFICFFASLIMTIIAFNQSNKIYRKENHLDDVGYWNDREESMKERPKEKRVLKGVLFSLIGGVVSILIAILDPAQNIFYYGGMIVSLISLLLGVISTASEYNRYATNPVPQYAKTGGGLDRAK